ncbi:copper amine oxidase domain protein, partial [Peptoniphilus harei]
KDGKEGKLPADKVVEQKAKTTADKTDPKKPTEKTEVADKTNLTDTEKAAVKKAIEDANKDDQGKSTLPAGTEITVGNDGTATITYPDKSTDTIKGSDLTEEKAKTQADKRPLQNEVDKKDDTKASDKYKNADKDKKEAYDKALDDAKKVLEDPKATQDDVNKAKKALVEAEKALNGKTTSDTDNTGGNDGYRPGHDGRDIFDRLFRRHEYVPTFPVYVTVPEKTETGVKVHDTLWYVFRINDFQYEVVRNGVVTKRLMDVTPVLQNGRTMLPLRYVAEALQADVKWDAKTRTATFTKDGLTASIQIDSDEIVLSNGKTVKMDSKPLNINDRILVSVTNVANVFGLTNGNTKDKADQDIEWEQQDKSATIYIRR